MVLILLSSLLALVGMVWILTIVKIEDWIDPDLPKRFGRVVGAVYWAIGIAYFTVGALAAQHWGLL